MAETQTAQQSQYKYVIYSFLQNTERQFYIYKIVFYI